MAYIITALTILMILCITLPVELFQKYKPLSNTLRINSIIEEREQQYENKILLKFIYFSKTIKRLIPLQLGVKNIEKTKKKIVYAGLISKITLDDFIALKYGSAFICTLYFSIFWVANPTNLILFLTILGGVMGYFLPDNWISIKAKNRQWKIEKDLPTLLSSLAIVTDAGLNLLQSIDEITKQNKGELAKELKKTLDDIQIGISQKDAFERLAERCNVEEINLFVSALIQGLEKGNSGITVLIREQAKESWEKRKQKAKELAEKASLKLFMPLLLLVFPAFIIFLMGPMVFSLIELFR